MRSPWPANLLTIPLGRVAEVRLGKMLQPVPSNPTDVEVRYLRAGSLNGLDDLQALPVMYARPAEIFRYAVHTGDLVVAEGGDAGRAEFLPELPSGVIMQNSLHCVRTHSSQADVRYIKYCLDAIYASGWLEVICNRATFSHLTKEKLTSLPIPNRSLSDQHAVADYLDAETARIDALLSTKQRMIELFRVLTDTLVENETGNLRGQCHAVPLKRLVREIDQRLGERTPPEMLSVSIHYGVLPRSQVTDKLPRAEELSAYKMCDRDDIVLNRMRAFQGGVGRSPQAGIVSPDYTVLRPCNLVLSRYLHYVFRSPWFVGEMTARLRGIGDSEQGNVRTPRINVAELGLIKVPLPSVTSQAQLVDKIDGKVAQMRTIIEKLSHQIDLLREHRQALITAAVTGELKIPVPEAVV